MPAGSATGATVLINQPSTPTISSLSCTPSTVTGPGSSACTVTLSSAAGSSGATVSLSSNNAAVTVPGSVLVASGAVSAAFNATVAAVPSNQTATLKATLGTSSQSFLLNLAAAGWTISGTTSSLGAGATVVLSGGASATTTADTSGNFSFSGLANGTYTVTPTKAGYAFTPASQPVSVNGANVTGVSFSATATNTQISMVNVTSCGPASFPGTACPIPATGSGHLIVVGWETGSAADTTVGIAVIDNMGDNYSEAARAVDAAAGAVADLWYAKNVPAGVTSVTVTPAASVTNAGVVIWEFAGADPASPLDQTAILNTQAASSPVSGGTVTTTASSEAIVSLAAAAGGNLTITAGNPFTNDSPLKGNGWAHLLTSSAGAYTAQWDENPAGTSAAVTASFKAASAQVTWSISGSVSSLGAGATVALAGAAMATATADASGNFTFSNLKNGTYTVSPSKPGYVFNPASQAVAVNSANVTGVSFTATAIQPAPSVDTQVSMSQTSASGRITSPIFSTKAGNELLLAFVSAGYKSGKNTYVRGLTGAGLSWSLVSRVNAQKGTAEIWRAFAPAAVNNVAVTAFLSASVTSSITVVSYSGVDPSGTNGSGAIGAVSPASGSSGVPAAKVVTTRNNSLIFGVGVDPASAVARTLGVGQVMVHQDLIGPSNTYWVQTLAGPIPASGTTTYIYDTAPTTDPFNLVAVEILAAPSLAPLSISKAAPALTPADASTAAALAQPSGSPQTSNSPQQASLNLSNAAASGTAGSCSPGGLVTVTGAGFTSQNGAKSESFPLATRLAGVEVSVNGSAAPLLYASDSQVNFQCPQSAPGTPLRIELLNESGVVMPVFGGTMQAAAPAVFTMGDQRQGMVFIAPREQLAAQSATGVFARPAHPGEFVTIYATGLGEVVGGVEAGMAAPLDRSVALRNKAQVVVGGVAVEPAFAGLAPGTAGVFQVNLRLPDNVPAGPAVLVTLSVVLSDGTRIESDPVTMAIETGAAAEAARTSMR